MKRWKMMLSVLCVSAVAVTSPASVSGASLEIVQEQQDEYLEDGQQTEGSQTEDQGAYNGLPGEQPDDEQAQEDSLELEGAEAEENGGNFLEEELFEKDMLSEEPDDESGDVPEEETAVKPEEPKLVKAYSYSYTKIKLVWEAAEGADGYHIYRKSAGQGWLKIAELEGGDLTSYIDADADTNTVYTYTARAYRWEEGEKIYSTYDHTGVSAKAVPNKSVITGIANHAPGELTIQWKKIYGADGYRVYRINEDGSYVYVTQVPDGSRLYYTETGLKIGESYRYKVRAYRTVDGTKVFGAYSDTVTGDCFLEEAVPPDMPVLTKAYSYSYSKIKIVWEPVMGADGYRIYRKTAGRSWQWIKQINDGASDSYIDTGAETGTSFTYTVKAFVRDSGELLLSDHDRKGVTAKAVPNKSAITGIQNPAPEELTIQWKKIYGADGYRVYRINEDGSYVYVTQVGSGNTLSYTEKGLEAPKSYDYKVRAYRIVDGEKIFGAYSDTVTGNSKLTRPVTPKLSQAYSYSYNKIKVVWEKGGDADGYYIYRKTGKDGWKQIGEVKNGKAVSYLDTNADTNVEYTYTVRAYKKISGQTFYSRYETAGVTAKAVPNRSVITSVDSGKKGTMTIQWKKISGADGYRVYRINADGSYVYVAQVGDGDILSYTEKNLKSGRSYDYKVRAYRTVGTEKVFGAYSVTKSGKVS